jgi:uncharacterized protein (DUF305 family)
MHALRVLGATVAALLVLSACGGSTASRGGADISDGAMSDSNVSADAMFAQMMIPHHEQAVVMADLAKSRASDPDIQRLAAQIRSDQASELNLMSSWLDEWGVPSIDGMSAMGAHGGHGMTGMLTQAQLDTLVDTTGPEFDRLFAEYMIEHHFGAISMAEGVLASGSDPRVAQLGREIIIAQQSEIVQLQAFLNGEEVTETAAVALAPTFTHVHGAVVSGAQTLLVGTHDGVHEVDLQSGATTPVGESRDDFMGFAGAPLGTLVASGHPGMASSAANPLGLIASDDAGVTWRNVSLQGEVDFHVLAADGSRIAGWDARGAVLYSGDGGQTWEAGPEALPTSLAWFRGRLWLATTDQGLVSWSPGEESVRSEDGVPEAVVLASANDGDALWGVDRNGAVYRSTDGAEWAVAGRVLALEAFTATVNVAYAVTPTRVQIIGN